MACNIIKANVVGMRPYTFTGTNGDEVRMVQLFFTYSDKRTDGHACGTMHLSEKATIRDGITLGDAISAVYYDKKWNYAAS